MSNTINTNVENTMNVIKDDINTSVKSTKKASKKRLRAINNILNERLRRNETRIRLREKVAKKREDSILEAAKEW